MNYSDFVPEELQMELVAIRDAVTASNWRVGDICMELERYVVAMNKDVAKMEIYKAVGSFAGKASRTVREYAHLAGFYPEAIRREFEVLSYDHFRTAAMLKDWAEALEWCVAQVETLGRPASVDAMEAKFAVDGEYNEEQTAYEYTQAKQTQSLQAHVQAIKEIAQGLDATVEERHVLSEALEDVEKVVGDIVLRVLTK